VLVECCAPVAQLSQGTGSAEVKHGGHPGAGPSVVDHPVCDARGFAGTLEMQALHRQLGELEQLHAPVACEVAVEQRLVREAA
jgi:hypothetical protein